MLYGQKEKNQLLKYCVKITEQLVSLTTITSKKKELWLGAEQYFMLCIYSLENEAFAFLASLILIAAMVLVKYDLS